MEKRKSERSNLGSILGAIAVLIAIFFVQNTPAYKKYYSDIMRSQYKVARKFIKLHHAISKGNKANMLAAYDDLSKQCVYSITAVKKMGAFKGDAELQEKALDMLLFYKEVIDNECYEILDIYKSSEDEIYPSDRERLRKMGADILERQKTYSRALNSADYQFRKKYNIPIVFLDMKDIGILLLIYFILWVLPVNAIGKFFETQRSGIFLCSGAIAVSVAVGHAVGLIAGKGDYLNFDFTIIIKILLAAIVFKFYMGTTYWKGLAISVIFWSCVFISTHYIYTIIFL